MELLKIVSISFQNAGKIFDFDARDFELTVGMQVVVETERGRALGTVVREIREIAPEQAPPKLKGVLRVANEADLNMASSNAQREIEALKFCQLRIQQRKMDMKLVRAEYLYDGSKIIFYFTSDGRVDFRELVRDLAQHFRTRIEMRQIGVRDEAKMVGGLGVCGRELCCATHLRSFAPVSVKMAKAQGLALNPNKISGQCGRLLCCLAYEYETYNEMRKSLPKCGKKVHLESGQAEVLSLDVLGQKMTVCCANGERIKVHVDELRTGPAAATETKPQPTRPQPARPSRPQPSRPKTEGPKKDAGDKQDESKSDRGERRRRPTSRNRRPKSNQPKAEGSNSTEVANAKPQQQQAPKPVKKQDQEQPQTDSQNRKRRNRRRPKRKPNKPQDSDNKA